jgi:tRNA U34 5-methylaminomethyl-2-thiouridine-forming methyltransferase MnmC
MNPHAQLDWVNGQPVSLVYDDVYFSQGCGPEETRYVFLRHNRLAERFAAMGYSSKLFNLRMTRHEIGSYLGLTLETVSRTLSAFNEIGLISVDQRTIGIKDADALKSLRRLPPSRTRSKSALRSKADAATDSPLLAAL